MAAPFDKDIVLDMWQAGAPAWEIADAIQCQQTNTVFNIVTRARKLGDPRAVTRPTGYRPGTLKRRHPVPMQAVDWLKKPDTSNLTLTGLMFGDPPRGRSALDQKRAAQP